MEEETSVHILCQYLGTFFLDPEEIGILSLGAIWNFSKATGLP
jgi:hypothetical protein